MNATLKLRVIRGRLVLFAGDRPPLVVGRLVICPCCGAVVRAEG